MVRVWLDMLGDGCASLIEAVPQSGIAFLARQGREAMAMGVMVLTKWRFSAGLEAAALRQAGRPPPRDTRGGAGEAEIAAFMRRVKHKR